METTSDNTTKVPRVKVIGAGFGRTGTFSLKMALEILGMKTYHMVPLKRLCPGTILRDAYCSLSAVTVETMIFGSKSRTSNQSISPPSLRPEVIRHLVCFCAAYCQGLQQFNYN
jgi:hypothetical protein